MGGGASSRPCLGIVTNESSEACREEASSGRRLSRSQRGRSEPQGQRSCVLRRPTVTFQVNTSPHCPGSESSRYKRETNVTAAPEGAKWRRRRASPSRGPGASGRQVARHASLPAHSGTHTSRKDIVPPGHEKPPHRIRSCGKEGNRLSTEDVPESPWPRVASRDPRCCQDRVGLCPMTWPRMDDDDALGNELLKH